jgi:hypothetical protein
MFVTAWYFDARSRWEDTLKAIRKIYVACLLGLLPALIVGQSARADDPNIESVVKSKILTCLHPTINAGKASVESQPSKKSGDTTTTRVKVFYEGLLKKNSLEMDVLVRESGSIRQLKVNVLSDSGVSVKACGLTKEWADF